MSTSSPSRLPLFVLGLVVGAAAALGARSLWSPPAPVAPAPAAPAYDRSGGVRAPQLSEGTFTVWFMIAPGQEELHAVASRAADGTEVWIMAPAWVAPSSTATDVALRVKYESPETFTLPQPLLNWIGTKPALRPTFHGKNLRAFVHDTVVPWDGTQARFCNP